MPPRVIELNAPVVRSYRRQMARGRPGRTKGQDRPWPRWPTTTIRPSAREGGGGRAPNRVGETGPGSRGHKGKGQAGSSAIQGRRCGSAEETEAAPSYLRRDPRRGRVRGEGAAWTRALESLRGPPGQADRGDARTLPAASTSDPRRAAREGKARAVGIRPRAPRPTFWPRTEGKLPDLCASRLVYEMGSLLVPTLGKTVVRIN